MKAMTEGVIWKQILLFTLPIMAGQFLQQLYNAVDGIVVGNFVSEQALAAVGTCSPVTMLFIAVALGLSTGCSIMVSQYFGAGRMEELRKAVSTSLILVTAVGLVVSVLGGVVAKWVLVNILAVEAEILADATAYFAIYCVGLVFQFAYNIVAAILRSLGDSKATLYFLLISSVTNIVLDLVFVALFQWGVPGVAVATVLAQALSAVASVIYMFRRYPMLRGGKGEFRFYGDMGKTALKLAVPTTIQQCVVSCGHIAIQRLVNIFGITAAYTAAMRMENFVLIPVFSFNAGLATFTGQNLGANRLDRVKKGHLSTLAIAECTCVVLGLVCYLAAAPLVGLFGLEGESLAQGVEYMRFMSPLFIIFCGYILTSAVLQGAGDVGFTAFNSLTGLVLRCAAAYLMAHFTDYSVYAVVWFSNPINWVYSLILAVVRYLQGKWKTKGIVKGKAPAA